MRATTLTIGLTCSLLGLLTGRRTRSVFERYNITSASDLRDPARKLDAAQAS